MAESTSGKSTQKTGEQKGSKRFSRRSASEHRKKLLSKTKIQRSHSSQSFGNEKETKEMNEKSQRCLPVNMIEATLLESSSFPNFFERVICPFCLEIQKDKIDFVEHLDKGCLKSKRKNVRLFSIFQIMPNNFIKCNLCEVQMKTMENYFCHAHSKSHKFQCSVTIQKGIQLSDQLYCSSCYVDIPDSLTQVKAHLLNEIHDIRRTGLTSLEFRRNGFISIFCIFNNQNTFKCLHCQPPKILFSTPHQILQHLQSQKHSETMKTCKIYCCFCKMELKVLDILFHFKSEEHLKNEVRAGEGSYELCFYCGLTTSTLTDLSTHMKLECNEIQRIRQGKNPNEIMKGNNTKMKNTEKMTEVSCLEKDTTGKSCLEKDTTGKSCLEKDTTGKSCLEKETTGKSCLEKKNNKEGYCILVKDEVDAVDLLTTFKQFGKIISVRKYNPEYLMIKYESQTSIDDIYIIKNSIRIRNKKICVKLPEELEEYKTSPDVSDSDDS